MAALPYMQLYVAEYLADTAHLTPTEHGAYLLLMFNYWQRGESFKAKDEQTLNKRLASVARMSSDEWENVKETISEFFTVTEKEWSHERIDRDLSYVNLKSEKARAAGKASATRRSSERSTNAQQTLNHKDKDTDTYKDKRITTLSSSLDTVSSRFDDFWRTWPASKRKVGKAACQKKWKAGKLDRIADQIIGHVRQMKDSEQWQSGFEPAPQTYLNQQRWLDGNETSGEPENEAMEGAI